MSLIASQLYFPLSATQLIKCLLFQLSLLPSPPLVPPYNHRCRNSLHWDLIGSRLTIPFDEFGFNWNRTLFIVSISFFDL